MYFFAADGDCGGFFLDDLRLPGQRDHGHDHKSGGNGGVYHVAALFGLALLRLTGGLGIAPVGAGQILTGLFFI